VNPKTFFAEPKRRNVYKVAIAYAVIAWLLVQIATQVFPFVEISNWAIRLVIMLLALGFPIAIVIAWAFELTPEGLKRREDLAERPTGPKNRAWLRAMKPPEYWRVAGCPEFCRPKGANDFECIVP
jgi:hypothetical protein